MSNSTVPDDGSLNNLYSALIECFTVILAGYLAGCCGMIKLKHGDSIKVFVWNLCLPALVLLGMWDLNFAEVNWKFLSCILVSKVIIFCLVLVVALLTHRPLNLGVAGIYGVFATASNDFALGYPMLKALYGDNSLYLKYIYLFAPISLAFLNPIGFILMEIHNARTLNVPQRRSKCLMFLRIFIDVLRNPIVLMTILGILCNLIFGQNVPGILKNILSELGNAFSATALFFLGLNLVGKAKKQLGFGLVVPFLLILTKTLLLPLIIWEIIGAVQPGSSLNETRAFGMYGFLYGTFPTAPSVFIFASQYSIAEHIIASGLVLCTILSAPLMFISAKMKTMTCHHSINYSQLIEKTSFDISILSLIASVWVIAVLILSGRWKKMPHQLTMGLTISQMLGAIGMISYQIKDTNSSWQSHLEFSLMIIGNLSSICWTSLLSVVICIIRTQRGTQFLRKIFLILFTGTGLPLFLTGILLIFDIKTNLSPYDPSFQFGKIQVYLYFFLTIFSIVLTTSSLIFSQRNLAPSVQCQQQPPPPFLTGHLPDASHSINNGNLLSSNSLGPNSSLYDRPEESNQEFSADHLNQLIDIEDEDLTLSSSIYERYIVPNDDNESEIHLPNPEHPDSSEEDERMSGVCLQQSQISRHLILTLSLLFTLCVAFFVSLWRLFGDTQQSGAYVEVLFLYCVLSNGQGFLLFLIFGLDGKFVVSPFLTRCRQLFCFTDCSTLCADARDKHNEKLNQICQQFNKYHKANCQGEIVRDILYGSSVHHSVFWGKALCGWLIDAGLTADSTDALEYGQKLLLGKLVVNVNNSSQCFTSSCLYRFS